MDATNDTPKRTSVKKRLQRLRLKKELAKERIELARLERRANMEELHAANVVPLQCNPGRDVLLEAMRHKNADQISLLEQAKKQGKQLAEGNFIWDWVSGYQDLIDRLRAPEGLLLTAISIAADRQYGSYWPFFRTWNDLALIRGASRIAYQTGCLARGALNSVASYIIGAGFVYRAAVKKGEDAPGLAERCQDILDENGKRNLWPLREFACPIRDSRDGEWYQRSFGRDDGMTDWRWIEPEQLIQPADSTLKEWSFGKKNPLEPYDVETILAYNACYDGNNTLGEEVAAEEVIGHTWNVDSTVKRGLPDLAYDCYDFLKTVSRLLDNMATGAAVQASFAYVRQWESPVTPDVAGDFVSSDADYTETNPWTGSTENVRRHKGGAVEDIPKGMNFVNGPTGEGGPNWVAIEQAVLSAVAIAWSAPKWLLSNDTDLNYASSLTAESPFVKRCEHVQSVHYEPLFVRAKWIELRNYCEAHGGIMANGRKYTFQEVQKKIEIQCEPPGVQVRDRGDEAQANAIRVQGGWKSRQTIAQEEGLDWEIERANIEEYNQTMADQMPPLTMPDDGVGVTRLPRAPHPKEQEE
jgi:hypothetical protein